VGVRCGCEVIRISLDAPSHRTTRLAITILTLGLIVSLIYHALHRHWLQPARYPFDSFMCASGSRFSDFDSMMDAGHANVMTPIVIALGWICRQITQRTSYAFSLGVFTLGWLYLLAYGLRKLVSPNFRPVFCPELWLMILSYPVLFNTDRGNPAGYVAAFIALGFIQWRQRRDGWAAFFFALATAIKITPAILGLFFIRERRWKAAILQILWTAVLTLGPVWFVSHHVLPGYSLQKFKFGMQDYFIRFVLGNDGLPWGSSLWGGIKLMLYWCGKADILPTMKAILPFYNVLSMGSLLLLVVLFAFNVVPDNEGILLITCWLVLMPQVTADYYLSFLLIPLVILCAENQSSTRWSVILLSLCVIPKAYMHLPRLEAVTIGSLINPILLVIVFFASLRAPLQRLAAKSV